MYLQNIDIFRMDYHKSELRKACRVCGKRVNKAKGRERSFLVSAHKEQLLLDSSRRHSSPPVLSLVSDIHALLAQQGRDGTIY